MDELRDAWSVATAALAQAEREKADSEAKLAKLVDRRVFLYSRLQISILSHRLLPRGVFDTAKAQAEFDAAAKIAKDASEVHRELASRVSDLKSLCLHLRGAVTAREHAISQLGRVRA